MKSPSAAKRRRCGDGERCEQDKATDHERYGDQGGGIKRLGLSICGEAVGKFRVKLVHRVACIGMGLMRQAAAIRTLSRLVLGRAGTILNAPWKHGRSFV